MLKKYWKFTTFYKDRDPQELFFSCDEYSLMDMLTIGDKMIREHEAVTYDFKEVWLDR